MSLEKILKGAAIPTQLVNNILNKSKDFNKKAVLCIKLSEIIDTAICNSILYNERGKIGDWIITGTDKDKINNLKKILLPDSPGLPKNKRLYKKYYKKIKQRDDNYR